MYVSWKLSELSGLGRKQLLSFFEVFIRDQGDTSSQILIARLLWGRFDHFQKSM